MKIKKFGELNENRDVNMTTQEIIKMLISIKKDADKLHSGNVAHQRFHIIADLSWLIDELSKENNEET